MAKLIRTLPSRLGAWCAASLVLAPHTTCTPHFICFAPVLLRKRIKRFYEVFDLATSGKYFIDVALNMVCLGRGRVNLSIERIAMALTMVLCTAIPSMAVATQPEWILHQKQRDSGKQTVYITADAIKIVNDESGYEVIARSPTWDVIIYRPDNKLGMKTTVVGFRKFSPFGPFLARNGSSSFETDGPDTIAGVKAVKLKKSSGATLWLATEIKAAPEISDILQSYNRFPVPGIPLKYRSRTDTAENAYVAKKLVVETFDCQRLPRTNKDFAYPTPKRWVKTQSEILSSAAKTNELNSIMDDLGVGDKLGK